MTKPINIRGALAAAATGLLGVGAAQALESTTPWEIDSRLLYYSETDRVSIVEGVVRAGYTPSDERSYGVTAVIDVMTGASPNGAIPTATPQTFTRPSGGASYTTPGGSQPLDDTFHDTRVALTFDMGHTLGENMHMNYSLQGSKEYDYQSFGGSVTLDMDFNLRNTTVSIGLSGNLDTSEPVGGIPDPRGYMPAYPAKKATIGSSDDKMVLDLQLGLTQVLTPRSLIRSNIVIGQDDGYLNDPYKIVSVVDPVTGELDPDPDARYRYENRPDSKFRWAWYTSWQQQLRDVDVLRLSYRLYGDDWGTISHTVDGFYRWQFLPKHFLEPHLRVYNQGAADFYRTSLPSDENPEFVSADYRLADMMTYTMGVTWGYDIDSRNQIRLGAEYYLQQADPSEVIGVQAGQDLIEDMTAIMVRLGYTLQW